MKQFFLSISIVVAALSFQACSPNLKKESASSSSVETKTVVTYTLPSKPNQKENAKTLLGIDSNENGLRDDVEIWIYTKHDNPIERAIYVQIAKAYQDILAHPKNLARNIDSEYKSLECESYWESDAKNSGEIFYLSSNRNLTKEISDIILNTNDRLIAFDDYTTAQEEHGDSVRNTFNLKDQCDFNAKVLLENKHVLISSGDTTLQDLNQPSL